jgi:type VI secretion system protein ImpK
MVDNNSDDPFGLPEGTILRPRPGGAGRRIAAQPGTAAQPAVRPGLPGAAFPTQGSPFQGPAGLESAAMPGVGAGLDDFVAGTDNPLLQSAAPLLLLVARLGAVQHVSSATLRQQAVQEIRACEDRLRAAAVAREDALVARYVLCTFVDTAVLNTPWGAQSDWASQSLLVMFHKEVSGGAKFFEIVDRVRVDPTRYIGLIELLYVCLALGYEGKYRHDPQGAARLSQLQRELFELIRARRALQSEDLSPHWKGVEDRRNPVMRYVPWWVIAAGGAAVLTIAFVVFRTRLGIEAEPIRAALAVPAVRVNYPAMTVPRASRLKELLAPEEAAGRLKVEEFADKTVVTLTAPNLFRSGSAHINPDFNPTLLDIGRAIEKVPGRVLVVGHTDDQPVHSLQFADNFDLSRARAVAVAQFLKPTLTNFGRVSWQGVGSTEPRYPMDTEENRARNRRVEIIHIPEHGGQP